MGWRNLYYPISTADNAAAVPTIAQKFRLATTSVDAILAGFMAGLFFYGNPVFTAITMEIWTDKGGSPGRLLATSTTSYLKAVLLTLGGANNSGYRLLGFAMPRIPLKKGMYYHAVVRLSGYTGTDASHVGWRQSYPDPQYRTGVTFEGKEAANFPFELDVKTVKTG